MALTIPTGLKRAVVLKSAMRALLEILLPLSQVATNRGSVRLEGTNEVVIPYYSKETTASKDYSASSGYSFEGGTVSSKTITINKRKYQPLSYTSEERNRQPYIDIEEIGAMKGYALATDILKDILSNVTVSNFAASKIVASSAFDLDSVIELQTACNVANFAKDRGLILNSTYMGALRTDIKDVGGLSTTGNNGFGALPVLYGFNMVESNILPTNSENLVGIALDKSALQVGFSPITPDASVMKQLSAYQVYTDPGTGITLEYRAWGDPDSDTAKEVIECNYGAAVGEGAGLIRIMSATISS